MKPGALTQNNTLVQMDVETTYKTFLWHFQLPQSRELWMTFPRVERGSYYLGDLCVWVWGKCILLLSA